MAALLQQIGGRQIDGDALGRQGQPHGRQGGAHPLPAFRHGLVRQPDHGEGRQPRAHLHLDIDRQNLDAPKGDRGDARDHEFRSYITQGQERNRRSRT
jgi:hypothetical protein